MEDAWSTKPASIMSNWSKSGSFYSRPPGVPGCSSFAHVPTIRGCGCKRQLLNQTAVCFKQETNKSEDLSVEGNPPPTLTILYRTGTV